MGLTGLFLITFLVIHAGINACILNNFLEFGDIERVADIRQADDAVGSKTKRREQQHSAEQQRQSDLWLQPPQQTGRKLARSGYEALAKAVEDGRADADGVATLGDDVRVATLRPGSRRKTPSLPRLPSSRLATNLRAGRRTVHQ